MLLHLFSGFYKPDQGLQTRLVTLILLFLTVMWGGWECYSVGYGQLDYRAEIPDPSKVPDTFTVTIDEDSTTREGGLALPGGYRLWQDVDADGRIGPDDIPLQLGMNATSSAASWHPDLEEPEERVLSLEVGGIDIEPGEVMHILLEMLVNDSITTRTEPWFEKQIQMQLASIDAVRMRLVGDPLPSPGPLFTPDNQAVIPGEMRTTPVFTQTQPGTPARTPDGTSQTQPGTAPTIRQSALEVQSLVPVDTSPIGPADTTGIADITAPNALNDIRGRIIGRWVLAERGNNPIIQATLTFEGLHRTDYRANPLPVAVATIIPPGAGHDPVTGFQINGSGIPWMAVIALGCTLFFLYLSLRFTMGVAMKSRPGGALSPRGSAAEDATDEDEDEDDGDDSEAARLRRKANKEHRREVRKQRKADAEKSAKRGLFNRVVEFLIETDREVKLVVWPTQKRVMYSSAVVILCTFLFGLIMFLSDFLLNLILDNLLGLYG